MDPEIRVSIPLLLFLVLLISPISQSFERKSAGKEDVVAISNQINEESVVEMDAANSFNKLMGLEECADEDEECLKRRVTAEAHLDYIYTQEHKH